MSLQVGHDAVEVEGTDEAGVIAVHPLEGLQGVFLMEVLQPASSHHLTITSHPAPLSSLVVQSPAAR